MAAGNERKPLQPVRRSAPLVPRAMPTPEPVRPKRKEARTIEVDCTAIAALMNTDGARPVTDLNADIEVVDGDPRAATPTRSGRLAHTKPRSKLATGSGALDPMDVPGAPRLLADGVPEPLEDMPTSATARSLAPTAPPPIALPLVAPPVTDAVPVQVAPEDSGVLLAAAPPRRRLVLGRFAFVGLVVGAWCAAAFVI